MSENLKKGIIATVIVLVMVLPIIYAIIKEFIAR
ncbi:MAG: hypothetical protein JWQ38_3365 [Flavipsychrobacter sp.]|nr:hypothetical protein [Flavipsychrobacter sp.]